jgi:hypothetical protein
MAETPPTSMRIAVLGAGAFGTSMAFLAASNGHEVRLYARDAEQVAAINRDHINPKQVVQTTCHTPAPLCVVLSRPESVFAPRDRKIQPGQTPVPFLYLLATTTDNQRTQVGIAGTQVLIEKWMDVHLCTHAHNGLTRTSATTDAHTGTLKTLNFQRISWPTTTRQRR